MVTNRASRSGGFTLIELLVVMAILTSLAALGFATIPRALRQRDKTVALERLGQIYSAMTIYQEQFGSLPKDSGAEFVLGPWKKGIIDKNMKEAEIFFDPSMTGKPDRELDIDEAVNAETIDFTGPDFDLYTKKTLRIQDRNSADHVIICNKVPEYVDEKSLDGFPHAGKGIAFLTLGGAKEFIFSESFSEGYPVIGPDSSVEKFQRMKSEGR